MSTMKPPEWNEIKFNANIFNWDFACFTYSYDIFLKSACLINFKWHTIWSGQGVNFSAENQVQILPEVLIFFSLPQLKSVICEWWTEIHGFNLAKIDGKWFETIFKSFKNNLKILILVSFSDQFEWVLSLRGRDLPLVLTQTISSKSRNKTQFPRIPNSLSSDPNVHIQMEYKLCKLVWKMCRHIVFILKSVVIKIMMNKQKREQKSLAKCPIHV